MYILIAVLFLFALIFSMSGMILRRVPTPEDNGKAGMGLLFTGFLFAYGAYVLFCVNNDFPGRAVLSVIILITGLMLSLYAGIFCDYR